MNKPLTRLLILFLSVSFFNCGDADSVKPFTDNAVAAFHKNYNSKNFTRIYNNSHQNFKKSGSFIRFKELMQAVYSKLGRVKSTRNKSWKVRKVDSAHMVSLRQKTEFRDSIGVEIFSFIVEDGKATLTGYKINSTKLTNNEL